jgi:hypothetical protein
MAGSERQERGVPEAPGREATDVDDVERGAGEASPMEDEVERAADREDEAREG